MAFAGVVPTPEPDGGRAMPKISFSATRRLGVRLVLIAGLGSLAGCAAPIIGGLTASQVFSLAGLGSTIMTGRDLAEHAVSMITGKDCRFLESLLRDGRSFCETSNSVATKDDFHGVVAMLDEKNEPGAPELGTKVAAADLDPALLGFAPVDRRAAEDFSLEIARNRKGAPEEGSRLSFGMLSAAFGQSWNYNVSIRDADAQEKLADATPPASAASSGVRPARGEYFGL